MRNFQREKRDVWFAKTVNNYLEHFSVAFEVSDKSTIGQRAKRKERKVWNIKSFLFVTFNATNVKNKTKTLPCHDFIWDWEYFWLHAELLVLADVHQEDPKVGSTEVQSKKSTSLLSSRQVANVRLIKPENKKFYFCSEETVRRKFELSSNKKVLIEKTSCKLATPLLSIFFNVFHLLKNVKQAQCLLNSTSTELCTGIEIASCLNKNLT